MSLHSPSHLRTLVAFFRADLYGETFELPASTQDWSDLIACAEAHGLLGLLYRAVGQRRCAPPEALLCFQRAAHEQMARSCSLAAELVQIISAFHDCGVKALCFKGPTLALRAYGQIFVRQCCDLDIAVHPIDLERAGAVLEQRGYRIDPKTRKHDGCYHLVFIREHDGAIVEVHWSLNSELERAPIEATGVWSRAQNVFICGYPILTLTLEDTLLFLCVHGFKHEWDRLKWITDVAYILRCREPIDWDMLLLRARETRCSRMLMVGLNLASSFFGDVLPPHIARKASGDRASVALAERVGRALFRGVPFDNMEAMVYQLHAREHFRDQLYLFARLFRRIFRLTPEDGQFDQKPAWSKMASLLRRPVRLYRSYGISWVKPIFRFR